MCCAISLHAYHAGRKGAMQRPIQPDERTQQEAAAKSMRGLGEALPYIVPYCLFAVLTLVADHLPDWRSPIYVVKVLAVVLALWWYRKAYTELRASFSPVTLVAVLVGVLVIVAWVGLDPCYPQSRAEWSDLFHEGFRRFDHAGKVAGQFDPYAARGLIPPVVAIVLRLIGAVLLVPIFEELFWRSWLMRWLVKDDFRAVPMGTFTWASFAITVALFGMTHHEWLAAMICGAAFNALLYWRNDLFLCVVAHAAANAALAVWVLTQGAWGFW